MNKNEDHFKSLKDKFSTGPGTNPEKAVETNPGETEDPLKEIKRKFGEGEGTIPRDEFTEYTDTFANLPGAKSREKATETIEQINERMKSLIISRLDKITEKMEEYPDIDFFLKERVKSAVVETKWLAETFADDDRLKDPTARTHIYHTFLNFIDHDFDKYPVEVRRSFTSFTNFFSSGESATWYKTEE